MIGNNYTVSTNGKINIEYDNHKKILNAMLYCVEVLDSDIETQIIKFIDELSRMYNEFEYRQREIRDV